MSETEVTVVREISLWWQESESLKGNRLKTEPHPVFFFFFLQRGYKSLLVYNCDPTCAESKSTVRSVVERETGPSLWLQQQVFNTNQKTAAWDSEPYRVATEAQKQKLSIRMDQARLDGAQDEPQRWKRVTLLTQVSHLDSTRARSTQRKINVWKGPPRPRLLGSPIDHINERVTKSTAGHLSSFQSPPSLHGNVNNQPNLETWKRADCSVGFFSSPTWCGLWWGLETVTR